jgi:hypothetical protein
MAKCVLFEVRTEFLSRPTSWTSLGFKGLSLIPLSSFVIIKYTEVYKCAVNGVTVLETLIVCAWNEKKCYWETVHGKKKSFPEKYFDILKKIRNAVVHVDGVR